jgi:protein-disulfide isomerase
VKRLKWLLLCTAGLLLAACGNYVPPAAERSPIEARQTERALAGLPPLPTIDAPPATALPTPDAAATAAATQELAALLNISADDPRAIGSPNAPVTIVEFSDFE